MLPLAGLHLYLPFNALNRNKRSLGLNLKADVGRQTFLRLADTAGVVAEESRPGVAKRLGIDYDTLWLRNPRLIYCAITGYGQNGPYWHAEIDSPLGIAYHGKRIAVSPNQEKSVSVLIMLC
jgi:crotonobetainyl-CoA:carnitine CoA-transferase CaiB-like acyl-CoA transferase